MRYNRFMEVEKSEQKDFSEAENSFAEVANEAGEYDAEKQFANKWNGWVEKRLGELEGVPIDKRELMNAKLEGGMTEEWEKTFVAPYVLGIRAAASELGSLAEQFINDEEGLGVDKSVRGVIGLLSEIYGLKQEVELGIMEDDDPSAALGWYSPNDKKMYINFGKLGTNSAEVFVGMVGAIAHEMWHAHQDEIADRGGTLREVFYNENFQNYKDLAEGYHGYRDQLIEDEAHVMDNVATETMQKTFVENRRGFRETEGEGKDLKERVLAAIRAREQMFEDENL